VCTEVKVLGIGDGVCFACRVAHYRVWGYELLLARNDVLAPSDELAMRFAKECGYPVEVNRLARSGGSILYGWAPAWFVGIWTACKSSASTPGEVDTAARRAVAQRSVDDLANVQHIYLLGGTEAVRALLAADSEVAPGTTPPGLSLA